MKHATIYLLLILLVILTGSVPFEGYDLGNLKPVETVYLSGRSGDLSIATDTGDRGSGPTWEQAMEDLENTASGHIFQGTVTYILLEREELLPVVLENRAFHPGCIVVLGSQSLDLSQVAEFLHSHKLPTTLQNLRARPGMELPRVYQEEERFVIA